MATIPTVNASATLRSARVTGADATDNRGSSRELCIVMTGSIGGPRSTAGKRGTDDRNRLEHLPLYR